MAIDPRISLAVQAPNVTPAIGLFNQAMQQKRANQLMPGQLDLQQQQVQATEQANQIGALNLQNAQDETDLRSIAQFGAMNEELLTAAENGDTLPLQKALASRARDLMANNKSSEQTFEALQLLQSGDAKTAVNAFRNAGKIAKQQGLLGGTSSTGTIERDRLLNDVNSDDPVVRQSALVKLGVAPRAVGSANQTIAESGNVGQVANVVSELSGASEGGKLEAQKAKLPDIKALVKKAEIKATKEGEVVTSLNRAKAALPGVTEVVDKLKELAPLTTSTFGGAVYDRAAKELGFGATKGATAKAKFVAMVDNQVLPLLKDTFGAAFTKDEAQSLRNSFANPDASTDEKLAQLDSFIEQKYRSVETTERELSGLIEQPQQPTNSGFKILSIE